MIPKQSQRKSTPGRVPTPAEIRTARTAAGLTQTAAGAIIYSSLRAWQNWEAGVRRMHPQMWESWQAKLLLLT